MRAPARSIAPICLAVCLAAVLAGLSALAADDGVSTMPPVAKPKPPAASPRNMATVNVVTFKMFSDGENHKLVVTLGDPLIRLDAIEDRYSIIYDPRGENYIGLEHSNDTYWQFSWPDVKAKVAQTKRYEAHMRDLLSQGINGDDSTGTASSPAAGSGTDSVTSSSTGDSTDTTGYIWKQTTEHKKISGLDCIRWTGESSVNPDVEAWCYAGPLPDVRAAMEKIREMNEPMALVPIRMLVPAFLFTVYDSISKGGATPVLVTWGGDVEKNKFTFAEQVTRDNKTDLFAIPKLYIKTTLVTMDGITQPIGGGN